MRMSIVLIALCLAACGGGAAGGVAGDVADDVTPDPTPSAPEADYYVDARDGDDANEGSPAFPFKTITRALAVARFGESVKVADGTYGDATGEIFPLEVPDGVRLLGTDLGLPPAVIILGTGAFRSNLHPTTIVPGSDSTLAGLVLRNVPLNPGASVVTVDSHRAEILGCVIERGSIGIQFRRESAALRIRRCVIQDNGYGMLFVFGGDLTLVEETSIQRNARGVLIHDVRIDMGGGPMQSLGGNAILDNPIYDLMVASTGVDARNCVWNRAPPTIASRETTTEPVPAGTDIVRVDTSVMDIVDTTGASAR